MSVRVRFAPSPTGYLHVGGLRTALYNYLFAKKNGGKFLLRIEDTDRTRLVEGATEGLISVLKWAGLEFDEGPGIGGPHSPYIQSQRTELYRKSAQELLEKGFAYKCFCTSERLDEMRAVQQAMGQPPRYDKFCEHLTAAELKEREDKNLPFVIRMKVPEKTIRFTDEIRGLIEIAPENIDDQVLIKSDGFPTYHLANVVDDHDMQITHVIRGEEWLPSTPKHILLYEYFGWQHPVFAHLPLLLNPDRSKLSKRQGDVAVEDFRAKGYLKGTLVNFVALLGWNPGDEREIFSMEELEKEFTLERVGKSGAIFNHDKLNWLNQQHIRLMDAEKILIELKPSLDEKGIKADHDYLIRVINVMKDRVNFISEFVTFSSYFFKEPDSYDAETVAKRWKPESKTQLGLFGENLKSVTDFSHDPLQDCLKKTAETLGIKAGDLIHPTRLAISGVGFGPSLYEMMAILGKETVLRRIEKALQVL